MRSPWRVPQRSAGRRARPELAHCRPERRRARKRRTCLHGSDGWHAPFGAPLPLCYWGASVFGNGVVVVSRARAQERVARAISLIRPRKRERGRLLRRNHFHLSPQGEVAPKSAGVRASPLDSEASGSAPPHPDPLPACGEGGPARARCMIGAKHCQLSGRIVCWNAVAIQPLVPAKAGTQGSHRKVCECTGFPLEFSPEYIGRGMSGNLLLRIR